MKKLLIHAAVLSAMLLTFPSALTALEFGGVVNNSSKLKTNSEAQFKFDQTDSSSMWIKVPVIKNKDTNLYFSTQATYSFERDFNSASNLQYVDLDLLKLVYTRKIKAGQLGVSAGRFTTSDISGYVFSQKADGVDFYFKNADVEVNLYGAYTGLLNSKVDVMLDYSLAKLSGDDEKLYDLAGKNLAGIAFVKLPSLFLKQNLSVQGIGMLNLEGEKYDRAYASVNLAGPLSTIVYYNACSTLGITKQESEKAEFANLTSASVTVFPPVLNSSVIFSAVYASGNQGSLKPFRGITSITFCDAFNQPECSGLAKTGIAFTVKPLTSVLVSGSVDCIFNAMAGEEENKIEYKGIQLKAGTDWQIVSDVMVGAKYSFYCDSKDKSLSKQQIAFNAVLKF